MNEQDHPSNPQTKNNNEKTKQSQNNNSTQQGPPTPATVNSVGNSSSPKVADCPELHNNAKIFFQNIHGLWGNEDKLEYILHTMIKQNIQAYLIAEPHLESNFIKYLPKGQIMIHHGPENNQNKEQKEV